MMHCHVCDEDIPLGEIVNHVRLLHPDAYPIADRVEIHIDEVRISPKMAERFWREFDRPPRRTG